MKIKKIIKIILIIVPIAVLLTILGNMIFWSLAMGKGEPQTKNFSEKELYFMEELRNNKGLEMDYGAFFYKKGRTHTISLIKIDSAYVINKNNMKKISDSVFTELMKVYSQKEYADTLQINIITNDSPFFPNKIDTSFIYLVK